MRKEWHEITERGRKILQILEDLIKVVEEINLEDVHKKLKTLEVPRVNNKVDFYNIAWYELEYRLYALILLFTGVHIFGHSVHFLEFSSARTLRSVSSLR